MRFKKVINEPIDHEVDGVHVTGGINAVVAANVNESGSSVTRVSSKQRIVQRNGKTEVFEQTNDTDDEGGES
ncbi:MAG: hypothetical protein QOC87_2090 [Actinomycetota bacterium]|jgi:hypothetical protein|nr:hypothetical protein [Actinomycetota bacterium]